jgi:hypothetical protein
VIGATSASAQIQDATLNPLPTSPSAPPAVDPRKPAVLSFATNLREAVDLAAQRMTERVAQIAPVTLAPSRAAVVRGLPLEGFGYYFDVQIPTVPGSSLAYLEMMARSQRVLAGATWAATPRSVAQGMARTAATEVATADPMKTAPVTEADLNAMYTAFVKEALIDAILDTAGVLTLTDADKLTVTASGDDVVTNQLQRINNRQLVLTMKGADFNALRAGRLTREQGRDRIDVKAF